MNLHHLKYFLTIAEEGSLSAASKKLLVGQPALSSQLKQFEQWLGLTLFDRQGKRLVITPEGEYVLKYAREIKGLEDELISNLAHADKIAKQELTLGAQESVPKSVLAHAIAAIRGRRNVHLKVIEGTGEELMGLLLANKIDIFIGNFRPLGQGKEIIYKSLGQDPISVWGLKEFSPLKKNFPDSLNGQSFILPGFQNQLRHIFEKYMFEMGLTFDAVIEAQDTALQKELALRGEGLVLLGKDSAKALVQPGKLIHIGALPGLTEEYWLGMVKRTIDNEYIRLILEAL